MAKKKSTKARAQQQRRQKRSAKGKVRSKAKARQKADGRSGTGGGDRRGGLDGVERFSGLPDRRAMEGTLARMVGDGGSGGDVARAQQLMYHAWDAPSRQEAVRLAKEALGISPDCADAYNLLAEASAQSVEEVAELYLAGVAAGERALGPKVFEEDAGHFWGLLETRPYMRAKEGLAQALWALGEREEAVEHYRSLLRLNPNDNQGIRHFLLACLLALDAEEEIAELLARYEDDIFAAWVYTRALLAFRRQGDSEESRELLRAALDRNPHVPAYLLGQKEVPSRLPDYMGLGDDTEAMSFQIDFAESWEKTPGALDWLRTLAG